MDKKQLRQQMIKKRNTLDANTLSTYSLSIAQHLSNLVFFNTARAVAGFVDFRNEVQMEPILQHLLNKSTPLMLPRISDDGTQMHFYQVDSLAHLVKSRLGIMEPDPQKCVLGDLSQLTLVLTPGVAFTRDGYRLGYGGGYYDRFFQSLGEDVLRIGLAFDLQIVQSIPVEPHDIRLHGYVTENGFNPVITI
ncbi:5-formyltetrahydrofolate cyclo-ligase [Fusibacter paucivorans]|uniref:5-formyltetrahydrofolate cyclo-ligase n=1 Tax=Fusibacter paucivorans TaxID=76009 RepID=A0ABS5PPA4_9FIRM|nr:5-formyltetrahydrofolate cyclo-ligase [Fusibacter paucivorans]MBS7527003.1 5-formyltetrahydrofolate cyclo-ligase [Fusibacter paucivorans]